MAILRAILLVVACVYMFGTLSAILEKLRVRPFVARSIAVACVIVAAYTHTWLWILGFTGIATLLYVIVRFGWEKVTAA